MTCTTHLAREYCLPVARRKHTVSIFSPHGVTSQKTNVGSKSEYWKKEFGYFWLRGFNLLVLRMRLLLIHSTESRVSCILNVSERMYDVKHIIDIIFQTLPETFTVSRTLKPVQKTGIMWLQSHIWWRRWMWMENIKIEVKDMICEIVDLLILGSNDFS